MKKRKLEVVAEPEAEAKIPKGIILKTGRLRLPDKLMSYLNHNVTSALYWNKNGESFSFDSNTVQTELLDKYFNGMKFTSFSRSLNRWGFRRTTHAELESKSVQSFEHPNFKRDSSDLVADMTMNDPRNKTNTKLPSSSSPGQFFEEREPSCPDSRFDQDSVSSLESEERSEPPRKKERRHGPNLKPQYMISQLQKMGDKLQSVVESSNMKRLQEQETASQLATAKAIAANRQSISLQRELQLRQLDLHSLVQSSISSQSAAGFAAAHPKRNEISTSSVVPALASTRRETPISVIQYLLMKLLTGPPERRAQRSESQEKNVYTTRNM